MLTKKLPPRWRARRAFGLELDEAGALWLTPEGEWVVVARGQRAPFVLNNLSEWQEVATEEQIELTADADGRVCRHGVAVAAEDRAWVLPVVIREQAIT
jgi:hypothetical protein